MMKAVLLAPITNSLYARLIADALTKEKDIEISAVIVRSIWNARRLRSEFKRDGGRLIRKIYQKLVIGDKRFSADNGNNLSVLARQQRLRYKTLSELAKDLKIPYYLVADHNHPKSLQILQKIQPDIIIFTGGGLLRHLCWKFPGSVYLIAIQAFCLNIGGWMWWNGLRLKKISIGLGLAQPCTSWIMGWIPAQFC